MSIIKKKIYIIAIFLLLTSAPSNAEEMKKIGKFKDWQTMILVQPTGTVCFAQSSPVLQAPKSNKRPKKKEAFSGGGGPGKKIRKRKKRKRKGEKGRKGKRKGGRGKKKGGKGKKKGEKGRKKGEKGRKKGEKGRKKVIEDYVSFCICTNL